MEAVLPVGYVLLDGADTYVEKEDCKMSQAMPNPEQQLRHLPEHQLHSGGEREREIWLTEKLYIMFDYKVFNITMNWTMPMVVFPC